MILFTAILAAIAIMLDAVTTYDGLRQGHSEANPIRRFLIRVLGLKGGTFGLSIVVVAIVAWVSTLPHAPIWSVSLGNLFIAVMFGYAAYSNYRKVY